MARRPGGVFEAEFHPPFASQYQLFARLRSADGSAVFSQESLVVWATLFADPAPVLVFIGNHYAPREKERLRQVVAEELRALGLRADFVDTAPEGGRSTRPCCPICPPRGW